MTEKDKMKGCRWIDHINTKPEYLRAEDTRTISIAEENRTLGSTLAECRRLCYESHGCRAVAVMMVTHLPVSILFSSQGSYPA